MQNVIKNSWLNVKNILVLSLGILVMFMVVSLLVNSRFSEIESKTRVLVYDQVAILSTISEITARNGADNVTESIVRDCSVEERTRFDNLLSQLNNNLPHNELEELKQLFGRCGSFYSERKTIMVSRLAREIEVYEDYVELLGIEVNKDLSTDFRINSWKSLASEERKQSELFAELVSLQSKIISTLLEGKKADSSEIIEILNQVKEVQENLLIARKQASGLRSELVAI
jgi:hypothetical protein